MKTSYTSHSNSNHNQGRFFAVLSGLCYSLLGYFGINLLNSGLSPYNMSFWRFLTAWAFIAIVYLIKRPKSFGEKKQVLKTMLFGMLFYTAPSSMFFLACLYIGTGQALVIFFVFPLWVVIINWLLGWQKFRKSYLFSFALTLLGLILLVDIGEFTMDLVGIGLSLLCSLSYALYIVFNKNSKLSPLSSSVSVLFACTISCFVVALLSQTFFVPETSYQWINIVTLGVVCTALPVLLLFLALGRISSSEAAFLAVLEPVFAVIFGVLLLGEVIGLNTFFGIVFILMGALSVSLDWQEWFAKSKGKIDGGSRT
jgi:drug/metabolite transporter (DMT)-like permease